MSINRKKLNRLKNKKIALLGAGIENISLLKFLLKKNINCEITICDRRSKKDIQDRFPSFKNREISFSLGRSYDSNLKKFDIIMRSPGYPLYSANLKKAKKKGVEISSPMKLFFDLCPTENIIGVTGSKGKGTVSSLIYKIIKKANLPVYLGGNIGVAPFDFLDKLNVDDYVVLELSSFQLEDMKKSPHIAVVTNLFKEHLASADPKNPNYHKTYAKYWLAKRNIYKHQKLGDFIVASKKLGNKIGMGRGIVFYSKSNLDSRLPGEHNKENIAACVEVARILEIKKSIIEKEVKSFFGLPHRIEKVAVKKGVQYYDDSFATTPESSIVALRSFKEPIVLLAGGADKGADFKKFAAEIGKRVKFLILFSGKGTDRLKKALKKTKFTSYKKGIKNGVIVSNMREAIKVTKGKAKEGDVALLSTGCASFGVFKNYKERGKQFQAQVRS